MRHLRLPDHGIIPLDDSRTAPPHALTRLALHVDTDWHTAHLAAWHPRHGDLTVPVTVEQAIAWHNHKYAGGTLRGWTAGDLVRLAYVPQNAPDLLPTLTHADGHGWHGGPHEPWTTLRLWSPEWRGYLVAPGTHPSRPDTARMWADPACGAWRLGYFDPDAHRMRPVLTADWDDPDTLACHIDLLRDPDAFAALAALAAPDLLPSLTILATLHDQLA